jgi:hypothetical protein
MTEGFFILTSLRGGTTKQSQMITKCEIASPPKVVSQ